jgi:hypothetical protein
MTLYAERPGIEPPNGPRRDPDDFRSERPGPGARRRLLVPVGAGALLVALSLTVWYAFGSGGRGGDGAVPLIAADHGPIKIRPEQPGGMEVPHQDKLVFERLNPGKAGTGKVERLLPGPEEPLPPPEAPLPEPAALPTTPAPASATVTAANETAPPQLASPTPVAKTEAPPIALGAAADILAAPSPAAPPAPAKPPPPSQAPVRPALPQAQPPAQAALAPAPAAGRGVRLQIASVPSEAVAKSELQRLQRRFPSELGSLPANIVRADLGARGVFYRVQVGPIDDSRASAVCSTLKAQSVGCIPVRP